MPDEQVLPPEEHEEEPKQEIKPPQKPEEKSWEPLDVSEGRFKDPEMFKTGKFRNELAGELRTLIPKVAQRKSVIDEILKERHGGIGKRELKEGLRKLKEGGKITPLLERKLRRKFGAF